MINTSWDGLKMHLKMHTSQKHFKPILKCQLRCKLKYKWPNGQSKQTLNDHGSLLSNLSSLSPLFPGVVCRFVPREANMTAHRLAKYALR